MSEEILHIVASVSEVFGGRIPVQEDSVVIHPRDNCGRVELMFIMSYYNFHNNNSMKKKKKGKEKPYEFIFGAARWNVKFLEIFGEYVTVWEGNHNWAAVAEIDEDETRESTLVAECCECHELLIFGLSHTTEEESHDEDSLDQGQQGEEAEDGGERQPADAHLTGWGHKGHLLGFLADEVQDGSTSQGDGLLDLLEGIDDNQGGRGSGQTRHHVAAGLNWKRKVFYTQNKVGDTHIR